MKAQFRDRILPPNHPLSLHVKKVVTRILHHSNLGKVKGGTPASISLESLFGGVWTPEDDYPAAGRPIYGPEKEWDVIVINDKRIINAAAAPGKCMVMVFTGILPVCKDEQGLAAVLAHGKFSYITPLLNTFPNRPVPFFPEIGHVVARHSAERVSSQTVTTALLLVLQAFGLDYLFTRPLHTFLLELPNSRTQELEADLIGLRLMARACYNPRAAPEMFERLAKLGDRKVDFFDTHPSSERRVRKLEEALPEAYTILNGNPQCEAMREQLERFREREVSIRDDASLEISWIDDQYFANLLVLLDVFITPCVRATQLA
ncbi:hypothetical protein NP233_g6814 [Leucocoprinus birnbaumii]|uniref:Peptidase M48 domain-containing protein n=1 Tax=Leucocoprinus birnbaumii TaxID=56174 RepID=A0AAD5VT54_9AGAR|nr:hypothetical protein NP233_g6814 [Leucocoprinus birnbaumii]